MRIEEAVAELDRLRAVEIWDNRDDLRRLADGLRENLGYDEESGYCNCSCCRHGV